MLVVFGNHVLIFSDKLVDFSETADLQIAWQRWHRSAVLEAARQLRGAERWLRASPNRVFLDPQCRILFPYPIPTESDAIFHRIVVAHGASAQCRRRWRGNGSLKLVPTLTSSASTPFAVGDLDPTVGYVHILDDTTLDIVMRECDTISDFVQYLAKKEAFVRSGRLAGSSGEEHLLACYLAECNAEGEHDFVLSGYQGPVVLDEGVYQHYLSSPERRLKTQFNAVSYAWDLLIERFARATINGTLRSHAEREKLLRVLARESRFRRRILADQLLRFLTLQPSMDFSGSTRIIEPVRREDPFYLFVNLPRNPNEPPDSYINRRAEFTLQYNRVMRHTYGEVAHTIVTVAVDPFGAPTNSEYIYLYDGSVFPADELAAAQDAQAQYGWLRDAAVRSSFLAGEYLGIDPSIDRQPPHSVSDA